MIRRVRKIVRTFVSARGEKDLKRHGVLIFATKGRNSTFLFQRVSEGSGIGSPHWTAVLESSCKMTLLSECLVWWLFFFEGTSLN